MEPKISPISPTKYSLSDPSVTREMTRNPNLREGLETYGRSIALRIAARRRQKPEVPSPKKIEWTDFIGADTSDRVSAEFGPPLSALSVSPLTGAKGGATGSVSLSPSPLSPPPPSSGPVLRPSLGQSSDEHQGSRPPSPLVSHPLPPSPPLAASVAPSSGVPALSQSLRAANSDPHGSRPPSPLESHPLPPSPPLTGPQPLAPEQAPLLVAPPPPSPSRRSPVTMQKTRRPVDLSKYIYEKRPPFNLSPTTQTKPQRSIFDLVLSSQTSLASQSPSPPHRPIAEPRDLQFRQVTFGRINEDLFARYFQKRQPLINAMKRPTFMVCQIEPEKISSWIAGFGLLLQTPDQINFEKAKPVEIYYALTRIVIERPIINKMCLLSLKEYIPRLRERMPDPLNQQLISEAEAKIQEKIGS